MSTMKNKMLRWLKGGKRNKSTKDTKEKDVYGFNATSRLGGNQRSQNLDSSLHIYHEIDDIPEISVSRQFTLLSEETHSEEKFEGPYLVVPILPERNIPASNSNQTCAREETLFTKEENKRKAYNEPWDQPVKNQDLSQVCSHPAFRDTNSSYSCSNSSVKSDSDTGCEYDMSMSTGSDVSCEYKELINKMQNNLILKHQILQIIKESENNGTEKGPSEQCRPKKSSFTSLDSCDLNRPHDVLDNDETESDYSSGFDECEINDNANISGFTTALTENNKKQSMQMCYDEPKKFPTKQNTSLSSLRPNGYVMPRSVPKPSRPHSKQGRYTNNRLLGDLISMNHNMQTMKF